MRLETTAGGAKTLGRFVDEHGARQSCRDGDVPLPGKGKDDET